MEYLALSGPSNQSCTTTRHILPETRSSKFNRMQTADIKLVKSSIHDKCRWHQWPCFDFACSKPEINLKNGFDHFYNFCTVEQQVQPIFEERGCKAHAGKVYHNTDNVNFVVLKSMWATSLWARSVENTVFLLFSSYIQPKMFTQKLNDFTFWDCGSLNPISMHTLQSSTLSLTY